MTEVDVKDTRIVVRHDLNVIVIDLDSLTSSEKYVLAQQLREAVDKLMTGMDDVE